MAVSSTACSPYRKAAMGDQAKTWELIPATGLESKPAPDSKCPEQLLCPRRHQPALG